MAEATAQIINAGGQKLSRQIPKFAVVGVLNTIIDIGIVNVMVLMLGFNPVISNIVGVSVAIINSYILNKYWTFKDKEKEHVAQQFGIFVVLSLAGMAINTAVFYFLYTMWTWSGTFAFSIVKLIGLSSIFKESFVLLNWAKAWSIAFSMIWNFIAYRKWTFKS
ncbi:hypothetical protein COY62_00275 [bacterium (Candidatus Howlettbacteria) CG_4_10_14_0_8_um_filter_40_9]|nr:MAG: hypothetical protein COY62_00275 [bacterium (Candidatus Howlettbacteria) CG_4_10_14_0_8_um_filter_40_9]